MARYAIAVLQGDGIGPEIMREGVKVLNAVGERYNHAFDVTYAPFGASAYRGKGHPFPEETRSLCKNVDGILKGPVGLPKLNEEITERLGNTLENLTIIELRGMHDAFLNIRPVKLPLEFWEFSPLKAERLGEGGIDILMMRELTGGIYFGDKTWSKNTEGNYAVDECRYTRSQIERFAHECFKEAQKRNVQLTSASKPNILATGKLWDEVFDEVGKKEYSTVPFSKVIVDAHATELCLNPSRYNGVVAYENLQGDILTDQAGGIIGSLGLIPSACINPKSRKGFFEPAHGSAPNIVGQGIANPYSMIGCVAFMFDNLGLAEESRLVWQSLQGVFAQSHMTSELVFKLTDIQKKQRVDRYLAEFLPLHERLGVVNAANRLRAFVEDHYRRIDEEHASRVVSTSVFGDKVVESILSA
ncbi:MAG: isocitrate/isopropylmalate family dehydrogenase [Nanoarchaeota archaeon]